MKPAFHFLGLFLLFTNIVSAELSVRTWTSADGRKLEAKLVRYEAALQTVVLLANGREFSLQADRLSELDQTWLLENAMPKLRPKGLFLEPEKKVIPVEVDEGKTVTLLVSDMNSDVVMVLIPGGLQTQEIGENFYGLAAAFHREGFSTVGLYTDFGALTNYRRSRQNHHFHAALKKADELLGGRSYVLVGSSNGGMTAMQAMEKNLSSVKVVAIVAQPTVHVAKRNLDGLPVYLRIGENDTLGWGKLYGKTVERLKRGGAKLDARLVLGAGHIPQFDLPEIFAWLEGHGIRPLGAKNGE